MTVCRPITPVETSCPFHCAVSAHSARCRLMIEVSTSHSPEPYPRTKHKVSIAKVLNFTLPENPRLLPWRRLTCALQQRGVGDLCARRLSRDLVSISASISGRRVSQLHSDEESKAQVFSHSRAQGRQRTAPTPVPRPRSRWSFRPSDPQPQERSRALQPNIRQVNLSRVCAWHTDVGPLSDYTVWRSCNIRSQRRSSARPLSLVFRWRRL